MRLVSFMSPAGPSWGIATDRGVFDMGRRLGREYATLRAALAADATGTRVAVPPDGPADLTMAALALLPPVPDPEKIICLGNNYRAHVLEAGGEIPRHPSLFIRLANTLVPSGGALIVPKLSHELDYEVELAVVIGRGGRHIARDAALGHVAGYTCFHDASVRDVQLQHSLAAGKNFVGTGGCGPWIVTADEIPDPGHLNLWTRLNGVEMQNGNTSDLIFDVPAIIAYVSSFTPLSAGDIIATGTPQGVGFTRRPPVWLKPGDVVEVGVAQIGVLRNTVVAEADLLP